MFKSEQISDQFEKSPQEVPGEILRAWAKSNMMYPQSMIPTFFIAKVMLKSDLTFQEFASMELSEAQKEHIASIIIAAHAKKDIRPKAILSQDEAKDGAQRVWKMFRDNFIFMCKNYINLSTRTLRIEMDADTDEMGILIDKALLENPSLKRELEDFFTLLKNGAETPEVIEISKEIHHLFDNSVHGQIPQNIFAKVFTSAGRKRQGIKDRLQLLQEKRMTLINRYVAANSIHYPFSISLIDPEKIENIRSSNI